MQKLSYEAEFLSFILRKICEKGGTRMILPILDLTKEMQKLDALNHVNLHRKQYGNTEGALKAMKKTCFIIDNIVIKMKDREIIEKLYKEKVICEEDYDIYVKTYEENAEKIIGVMKINKQNKCKVNKISLIYYIFLFLSQFFINFTQFFIHFMQFFIFIIQILSHFSRF